MLTGITRNPWDASRTAGGSSGGAAVACACGAGVLHLGTDGGGSIRIPAAFCGVVGHKPTFGRVPAYPASSFGTIAHLGPIARSVADAALMLQAMSGHDLRDWQQSPWPLPAVAPLGPRALRGLRVAVWDTPPHGTVAPAVRDAFAAALDRIADAGAELARITPPGEEIFELFTLHWNAGAAARLAGVAADALPLVEPGLRTIAQAGARLSALDLIAAQVRRAAFGAAFDRMLAAHDVLVSPAVAVGAFAAGEEVPENSGLGRWTEWAGFSYPVNSWRRRPRRWCHTASARARCRPACRWSAGAATMPACWRSRRRCTRRLAAGSPRLPSEQCCQARVALVRLQKKPEHQAQHREQPCPNHDLCSVLLPCSNKARGLAMAWPNCGKGVEC